MSSQWGVLQGVIDGLFGSQKTRSPDGKETTVVLGGPVVALMISQFGLGHTRCIRTTLNVVLVQQQGSEWFG